MDGDLRFIRRTCPASAKDKSYWASGQPGEVEARIRRPASPYKLPRLRPRFSSNALIVGVCHWAVGCHCYLIPTV